MMRNINWIRVWFLLFLLKICSARVYQNVALRGKATQSSKFEDSFSNANNAIDGNRESNYMAGSCTQTDEQRNPWWRVDLLENYIVTSITVTNRGDCCAERLDGAEIHVGNSLLNNGAYNPVVAVIPHKPEGRPFIMNFSRRVEGRYVSVFLPGLNRVLTLCEVEVYGYRAPIGKMPNTGVKLVVDANNTSFGFVECQQCSLVMSYVSKKMGENLAIHGKASQSSVYEYNFASSAIDGDRRIVTCTHTHKDFSPWWRLDLGKTHRIFSVNVTNRIDSSYRLNGAEIRIGDSLGNNGNNNPRCAVISSIPGGFTQGFDCGGMDGRFVNIVIPGRHEFLHICQVEVYGSVLD